MSRKKYSPQFSRIIFKAFDKSKKMLISDVNYGGEIKYYS